MNLLIKSGRVIDPLNGRDEVADVLVENGKIGAVQENIKVAGAKTIEAAGKIVCPGFIDMHTHLREPGQEHKETIATGTRAAARGGFTSIGCMANTNPVVDNRSVVEFILKKAKDEGVVNVFPFGALSKNLQGEQLAQMGEMKEAGIVAVSDDGNVMQNSELMRRAMEYAAMLDLPVVTHCGDKLLEHKGVMNEGYISTLMGLRGMPAEAEAAMAARDILLSELTGCRLHIAHVSTRKTVEQIRQAKRRGIRVSTEAAPHHFTLTDEFLQTYDTNFKMAPPLRTKDDVLAVREGLKDGTIDCIATDHAPHADFEKEVEFDHAPFGVIGLETALGVSVGVLVSNPGVSIKDKAFITQSVPRSDRLRLTLAELVGKLSCNPARLLGLNQKGALTIGMDGDVTIFDPEASWMVDINQFASKARNCPFHGWELKGAVIATVVGGKVVYQAGSKKA